MVFIYLGTYMLAITFTIIIWTSRLQSSNQQRSLIIARGILTLSVGPGHADDDVEDETAVVVVDVVPATLFGTSTTGAISLLLFH